MTLDECRDEARRRWGNLTPFRLGIVVGDMGLRLSAPYSTERARRNYFEGRSYGETLRGRRAYRRNLEKLLADKIRIGDVTLANRIRAELEREQ